MDWKFDKHFWICPYFRYTTYNFFLFIVRHYFVWKYIFLQFRHWIISNEQCTSCSILRCLIVLNYLCVVHYRFLFTIQSKTCTSISQKTYCRTRTVEPAEPLKTMKVTTEWPNRPNTSCARATTMMALICHRRVQIRVRFSLFNIIGHLVTLIHNECSVSFRLKINQRLYFSFAPVSHWMSHAYTNRDMDIIWFIFLMTTGLW